MLPQVVLGHPPGCGCARAQSVKASLLLILGDVEEALDNDHPFVGQLPLERADVLERLAESSPLNLPLDPVGHYPAIPTPVEDGQPPAGRRPIPEPPQEWVECLLLRRPGRAMDGEPSRVKRQNQFVDQRTLAGRAPALEDNNDRDA